MKLRIVKDNFKDFYFIEMQSILFGSWYRFRDCVFNSYKNEFANLEDAKVAITELQAFYSKKRFETIFVFKVD